MMNIWGAIQEICTLAMNMSMEKRRGLHDATLWKLKKLLENEGWSVRREVKKCFDTIIRYKNEDKKVKGRIDLVAYHTEMPNIAIEFDNTNVLKYRSIEKLLQYQGIAIGITAGRSPVNNQKRIEQVMQEQGTWSCKEFWLIEVVTNRIRRFTSNHRPCREEWQLTPDWTLELQ